MAHKRLFLSIFTTHLILLNGDVLNTQYTSIVQACCFPLSFPRWLHRNLQVTVNYSNRLWYTAKKGNRRYIRTVRAFSDTRTFNIPAIGFWDWDYFERSKGPEVQYLFGIFILQAAIALLIPLVGCIRLRFITFSLKRANI